jgi:hypothetical protein
MATAKDMVRTYCTGSAPPGVLSAIRRAAEDCGVESVLVRDHRCRLRDVVRARRQVCLELRRRGMSLAMIGRYLGLHHTTVLYHLRRGRAKPEAGPVG